MCKVFAGQDPDRLSPDQPVDPDRRAFDQHPARGHVLGRFSTRSPTAQGLTTPKFISKLYDEAIEINGEIPNFASMLRTTCALYLRGHRPAHGDM